MALLAEGVIAWSSSLFNSGDPVVLCILIRPLLIDQVPDSVAGDGVGCACQTKFKLSIFWKVCAFLEVTVKTNKQIRTVNPLMPT